MLKEIEDKMVMEAYPGFSGPCDKPNINEDIKVLELQREAYRRGLRDSLESLWKPTAVFPEETCQVIVDFNGQVVFGAYGSQFGMFYSDDEPSFRSCKWVELPKGQWLNITNILLQNNK